MSQRQSTLTVANLGSTLGDVGAKESAVRIRHVGRIIDDAYISICKISMIRNVGNSGDHSHVELPFKTFLYDFHVKHAKKSAAEAEAQRIVAFRLEAEG